MKNYDHDAFLKILNVWKEKGFDAAFEYAEKLHGKELAKHYIRIIYENSFDARLLGNPPAMDELYPMSCPRNGEFTAYKAVALTDFTGDLYQTIMPATFGIATLLVPSHAERSSAFGKKCRCSEAIVVAIEEYDFRTGERKGFKHTGFSFCASTFGTVYEVGKTVYSDWFDENRFNECSHGIHFFMTKLDAKRFACPNIFGYVEE